MNCCPQRHPAKARKFGWAPSSLPGFLTSPASDNLIRLLSLNSESENRRYSHKQRGAGFPACRFAGLSSPASGVCTFGVRRHVAAFGWARRGGIARHGLAMRSRACALQRSDLQSDSPDFPVRRRGRLKSRPNRQTGMAAPHRQPCSGQGQLWNSG
jgi:hypothetical protein